MGEFFKPWRRKSGVAALAVACVLGVGWVRNLSVVDSIYLYSGSLVGLECLSMNGQCKLSLTFNTGPAHTGWDSYLVSLDQIESRINSSLGRWVGPVIFEVTIPLQYCYVVPSMTLLSAYLLLSKPRPSSHVKTAEPIPAEKT